MKNSKGTKSTAEDTEASGMHPEGLPRFTLGSLLALALNEMERAGNRTAISQTTSGVQVTIPPETQATRIINHAITLFEKNGYAVQDDAGEGGTRVISITGITTRQGEDGKTYFVPVPSAEPERAA